MNPIISISSIFVILLLGGFWAWMFWDMTNHDTFQTTTKYYWTLAFVFLNVFAAAYYYVYEYRNRY